MRALKVLALAAAALFGLLLGGFAVDPFRAVREVNEARLRAVGARVERFRCGDCWLRVIELGPLSAAKPVVLLHGLGAAGDYWTGAAIALARSGRTVLLPDAAGSGGSERPREASGYGLAARVSAVEGLASSLGLATLDLVGHSLGGWTAALYALEHPRRVERLVLVDAGGFTHVEPSDEEATRRSLSPRSRDGSRRLVDLLFFRKPFPLAGFTLDAFARNYGSENVVATLDQLSASDSLLGRENQLPRGTVLIWGAKEILFPLADARRAAARIPGGRLFVLRGVGHDGPLEAPEAFEEALFRALETPGNR